MEERLLRCRTLPPSDVLLGEDHRQVHRRQRHERSALLPLQRHHLEGPRCPPTEKRASRSSEMRTKETWHGLTNWQAAEYRRGKSCEICGSKNRLVVDHDHQTKAIRGVLCSACNMVVGVVENKSKLNKVIAYVSKYAIGPHKVASDFSKYKQKRGPAPPHGTVSRYNYRFGKCRCRACKDAMRDRERRVSGHVPRPPEWGNPQHGTYAKYQQETKQGLTPCAECREANRLWQNQRNQKLRKNR